jgi:hypothetical protein
LEEPTATETGTDGSEKAATRAAHCCWEFLCIRGCPSEANGTIEVMFQILVACSSCAEEAEVVVQALDDVDREVCPCGYSYVVLAVSEFEPVYAERAEVVELPRRRKLQRAA